MADKFLKHLVSELLSQKNERDMEEFLKALFTSEELKVIPKRLEIVKLLKRGASQRFIAEKLGVGIATVTRGAREIKNNRFRNVA